MFVLKVKHKFNQYIGKDKKVVRSIYKAKKFETTEEAETYIEAEPVLKMPVEILRMRKV